MEMELVAPARIRVGLPSVPRRNSSGHAVGGGSGSGGGVRFSPSFGERFPISFSKWKSLEVHRDDDRLVRQPAVSINDGPGLPQLSFNRLQPSDQEYVGQQRHYFGRYVAGEAVLDEEYWTAAWLRAEAHWEPMSYMRHVASYKKQYAEQEFYALKRRCSGQDGNSLKCFCLVALKKEDKNVRRTVLNSVVGTLDLSIRQFLQGETYPGVKSRPSAVMASYDPFGTHRYAYVANVCVSKFGRRQGIASNLLYLAINIAMSAGMNVIYVHVNADNKAAQGLYAKAGFELVEGALPPHVNNQLLLMSLVL